MGMPEQPQSGMNIAPDGTVYEILEDGTIKRIGKVSPDGSFEPFGGAKEGIREKDGIIYRVVNGKEVKIGRILPNGEIETISQKIKSETEIARSKVKIVTIVSVCALLAFFVALYAMQQVWKTREYDNKVKPVYSRYLDEITPTSEGLQGYINQLDKLIKLEEVKYIENKRKIAKIIEEIENRKVEIEKAEAKRAEEERKKREAEKLESYIKKGRKIDNLIWSDRSRNEMDWSRAKQYCENLTESGFDDWRLPNIDELRTTIKNCSKIETDGECKVSEKSGCLSWNPCRKKDSCDCIKSKGVYSKLGDDGVWLVSSSPDSGSHREDYPCLWGVSFHADKGYKDQVFIDYSCRFWNASGELYYVRCVRDAQ